MPGRCDRCDVAVPAAYCTQCGMLVDQEATEPPEDPGLPALLRESLGEVVRDIRYHPRALIPGLHPVDQCTGCDAPMAPRQDYCGRCGLPR